MYAECISHIIYLDVPYFSILFMNNLSRCWIIWGRSRHTTKYVYANRQYEIPSALVVRQRKTDGIIEPLGAGVANKVQNVFAS